MSQTRRELIIQKYCALELELSQYFDSSLFPSLQDIDLADMVTYITMIFLGIQTVEDYRGKIREMITTHGVDLSEEVFEKVAPLITEFVTWLKQL